MMILDASFCTNASSLATILLIKNIIKILSVIVPVVLILMVVIDMVKAVIAHDENDMKTAQKTAIKRIACSVVIFFIPLIVESTFSLLKDTNVPYSDCYENATDENIEKLLSEQRAHEAEEKAKRQAEAEERRKELEEQERQQQENWQKKQEESKEQTQKDYEKSKSGTSLESSSSNVRSAKTYKRYHSLGTVRNLKHVFDISPTGDLFISQSLTVVGNNIAVFTVNRSNSNSKVSIYNKSSGKKIKQFSLGSIGHGNGAAYNPTSGQIYIIRTNSKKLVSFSDSAIYQDAKAKKKDVKMPYDASGIGYDRALNFYALSGGRYLNVWDGPSQKKTRKVYNKVVTDGALQDIGAHDGVIYVGRYTGSNYIDLYRASDGKYLGTYQINVPGELESIDYYGEGNKFVILCYNSGTQSDKVYVTDKIKIK